jgi:nucleoside-diphosphate-sugar epimerase
MIRWIDDTLGTAAFDDPDNQGVEVFDVRVLVDGAANSRATLLSLINRGVERLNQSNKLVVCCDFGISRSNTIAAALIAIRDRVTFDAALDRVQQKTQERRMDFGLVNCVRAALTAEEGRAARGGPLLVTGGSGFLGSWLRRVLPQVERVIAPASQLLALDQGPYALDRLVRETRPSAVVHLANPRVYQTPEIVSAATGMMRNVLEVCGHHGTFLVFASSWNVLNGLRGSESTRQMSDDAPCRPYGNYAVSKALCETMIEYATETSGARVATLRLSPVYGHGSPQPRFIYRTSEALRAGEPVITHRYRNGRPSLQLLHASDAARAILEAATRSVPGRFNVGGQRAITTRAIAETIANVLGIEGSFCETELDAEVAHVTLDCTKARGVLGWTPLVTLEDGLRSLLLPDTERDATTRPADR